MNKKEIIELFLEITKIPRCSYNTKKMQNFLVDFAKKYGYSVEVDKTGNILATKNSPKLCLQAHYDMVCVKDAPNIEPIIENGKIKAKNSSLGADNGAAIAIMLKLMQEGANVEFLFTNDEEVGLIGANNLELNIKSKYMLNLDSEDEAVVFIGCAGGIDLKATKELKEIKKGNKATKIEVQNLPGGHSGVDIDKNIKNAIYELCKALDTNCLIAEFKGGEKINSIPANAAALVEKECNIKKYKVKELSFKEPVSFYDSSFIKDILDSSNGVIEYNKEFNVVESSSNLSLVKLNNNKLEIEISIRSLDNNKLNQIANSYKKYWQNRGYSVKLHGKYPGWKPEVNEFTQIVSKALKEIFKSSKELVIHAGLECGVLKNRFKNIKFASIGPNIKYPHSAKEECEIDSIYKTYEVVKKIIKMLS